MGSETAPPAECVIVEAAELKANVTAIFLGCGATQAAAADGATVIDGEAFTPLIQFKASIRQLIDHVNSSRRVRGSEEFLYPGEPEARHRQERLKDGIPIHHYTWDRLARQAAKVGVAPCRHA